MFRAIYGMLTEMAVCGSTFRLRSCASGSENRGVTTSWRRMGPFLQLFSGVRGLVDLITKERRR